MGDNPVKGEVENFKKASLKKTTTTVKEYVPTQNDIDQEKKEEKKEQK